MTATDTIEARVARGAALLDEKRPGWDREIDLAKLDIGSCADCVLGQLYGEYMEGLNACAIPYPVRLGFDLARMNPDVKAAINAAWRSLVLARRSEA